jgi:branched-chain amino acid transport system ATP-binding protein
VRAAILRSTYVRTRAGVLGAVLRDRGTLAEESAIERRALELLEYVGIATRANDAAGSLPYGDQRRLEIARALATEPKLLALDEPAAGMNPTESSELMRLIRQIRDRFGVAILLIDHDMGLVMDICVLLRHQALAALGPCPIAENTSRAHRRD